MIKVGSFFYFPDNHILPFPSSPEVLFIDFYFPLWWKTKGNKIRSPTFCRNGKKSPTILIGSATLGKKCEYFREIFLISSVLFFFQPDPDVKNKTIKSCSAFQYHGTTKRFICDLGKKPSPLRYTI